MVRSYKAVLRSTGWTPIVYDPKLTGLTQEVNTTNDNDHDDTVGENVAPSLVDCHLALQVSKTWEWVVGDEEKKLAGSSKARKFKVLRTERADVVASNERAVLRAAVAKQRSNVERSKVVEEDEEEEEGQVEDEQEEEEEDIENDNEEEEANQSQETEGEEEQEEEEEDDDEEEEETETTKAMDEIPMQQDNTDDENMQVDMDDDDDDCNGKDDEVVTPTKAKQKLRRHRLEDDEDDSAVEEDNTEEAEFEWQDKTTEKDERKNKKDDKNDSEDVPEPEPKKTKTTKRKKRTIALSKQGPRKSQRATKSQNEQKEQGDATTQSLESNPTPETATEPADDDSTLTGTMASAEDESRRSQATSDTKRIEPRKKKSKKAADSPTTTPHESNALTLSPTNLSSTNPSPSGTPLSTYEVGDIVEVEARTWPGINKHGGTGRITRVHRDTTGDISNNDSGAVLYDVKYVLGGTEKRVAAIYVKTAQQGRPKRSPKRTKQSPFAILHADNEVAVSAATGATTGDGAHSNKRKRKAMKGGDAQPKTQDKTITKAKASSSASATTQSDKDPTAPPSKKRKNNKAKPKRVLTENGSVRPAAKKPKQAVGKHAVTKAFVVPNLSDSDVTRLADEYYKNRINAAIESTVVHIVGSSLTPKDSDNLDALLSATKKQDGESCQ